MIPKPAEESEDRRTVSLEFALEKYWGKNVVGLIRLLKLIRMLKVKFKD